MGVEHFPPDQRVTVACARGRLFTNRAASHLRLKSFDAALADTELVTPQRGSALEAALPARIVGSWRGAQRDSKGVCLGVGRRSERTART